MRYSKNRRLSPPPPPKVIKTGVRLKHEKRIKLNPRDYENRNDD